MWLIHEKYAENIDHAIKLGQRMYFASMIRHIQVTSSVGNNPSLHQPQCANVEPTVFYQQLCANGGTI